MYHSPPGQEGQLAAAFAPPLFWVWTLAAGIRSHSATRAPTLVFVSCRPQEKCSFAKTHMYCIVLADRPHGSWKCTFLKTGLRVETSKNAALPFLCGQRICILFKTMTPSPYPSTSCLRPLNPTTSHNNNNNNGGLHACVCAAEDIEPCLQLTRLVVECESQQQTIPVSLPSPFWSSCCVWFLLLLPVYNMQA